MNVNVLLAVFKRNFVSYFSSPTGYVFICVFVLLSSFAAFWPNEFFNTNLANLDQLNKVFPFIMLIFIPAITMSIWAEERRQGTDELLLTIPASDLDIVLGKYLAAVAIFSVSLLFSLVCNFLVLQTLGSPDAGLFLGTYVGYWMVGLAMLAVGMVASFLTGNLTVGFILGAVFNTPLVFAAKADAIAEPVVAMIVKQWSVGQQFADFGRGVISLSGLAYFLMIVAVMLYLSMVLIGRRHWYTGEHGKTMAVHFTTRTAAMALIVVGLVVFFSRHDRRLDVTNERLSSLSPDTRKLLKKLDLKRPVQIEAFISPSVPESYVQTRLNLLTMLRELEASGSGKVSVLINQTERFSEEAARAEQRYGIAPRQVSTLKRGALSIDHIFLGVAMTSGLEKVILPFVDRGIPVEYELARSIATVCQQERQRVGVITTDAQIYGRFNMQMMSASPNWPIIEELEKQYDVEQVDPTSPITEEYDVLLAVQPSSLGPDEMNNFIAAVESGQKTAIFEDPFPVFAGNVPATSAPRAAPGGMNPMMMMGRQQGPPPKGDISRLWRLLGIDFSSDEVVWQDYNPYPKAGHFPAEFVFVDDGSGAQQTFNEDAPITSKLQHLLFPFPGSVSELHASELEVTPLVRTGVKTGTVKFSELTQMGPFGRPMGLNPMRRQKPTSKEYLLAVQIRGKLKPNQPMADEGDDAEAAAAEDEPPADVPPAGDTAPAEDAMPAEDTTPAEPAAEETPVAEEPADDHAADDAHDHAADDAHDHAADDAHDHDHPHGHPHEDVAEEPKEDAAEQSNDYLAGIPEEKPEDAEPEEVEINVVLVADIDMLYRDFFRLREQGSIPEAGVNFDFDNVTFVLNVLDALAGDDRFMEIRKRRPRHRTLTGIEEKTEARKEEAIEARERFNKEFDEDEEKEQKAFQKKIDDLQNRKDMDPQQMLIEVAMAQQDGQRRRDATIQRLKQERDREINKIETKLTLQIRAVQDRYKLWAVMLPPIPPLVVGVIVFFIRRSKEREGVSRARLR